MLFSMMWFCELTRVDESVFSESKRLENLLMSAVCWVGTEETNKSQIDQNPQHILADQQRHLREDNFPNTLHIISGKMS